jgi:hypothetical protein
LFAANFTFFSLVVVDKKLEQTANVLYFTSLPFRKINKIAAYHN